jgi:hypothetical protein
MNARQLHCRAFLISSPTCQCLHCAVPSGTDGMLCPGLTATPSRCPRSGREPDGARRPSGGQAGTRARRLQADDTVPPGTARQGRCAPNRKYGAGEQSHALNSGVDCFAPIGARNDMLLWEASYLFLLSSRGAATGGDVVISVCVAPELSRCKRDLHGCHCEPNAVGRGNLTLDGKSTRER